MYCTSQKKYLSSIKGAVLCMMTRFTIQCAVCEGAQTSRQAYQSTGGKHPGPEKNTGIAKKGSRKSKLNLSFNQLLMCF